MKPQTLIVITVILLIGYIAGYKYPMLGQKVGL